MVAFDFGKVGKLKGRSTDPDWSNPVSFFYKLTHPDIKDLFPAQRDILKNWFASFKAQENDKIVSLNTGGGKTLIGLMIAESIRRETGGKVIYVCPNNYLGIQTVEEAIKYGFKVASYLKTTGERPTWSSEAAFLDNQEVCVTTYPALLNPRSIFKDMEIKGVIFDDAHLSLDLLDDQYSLRSDNSSLIKSISDIFKTSDHIKEKIAAIQEADPLALVMIPPFEWHSQAETVKAILNKDEKVRESLTWMNIKEKIDRTFCFISASRIEIGFLYPDIKNHFVFTPGVHRVYLSATVPNLDDLTRVFGVTPSRIQIDNPDYRPERLFVFSKKLKIENAEELIRNELLSLTPKTLVLGPSNDSLSPYAKLGALIPNNSADVPLKIKEFKAAEAGILALANRYDGIDMPGGTCHSLLVDGLPYTVTLKNRFFSEYFHNHKNSFLRSILAAKLVQAFGRTIRANNDYSVIFLLGGKLNSWMMNRDNRKFFRADLSEDIEIGSTVSDTITTLEELRSLVQEILGQTEAWKVFFEEKKSELSGVEMLSAEEEKSDVSMAQKEREIHDLFMEGKYKECLEKILSSQNEFAAYSKPILGLYLSMAVICSSKISDVRMGELSARAYGINPVFGSPVSFDGKSRTLQAQRIVDYKSSIPGFDWKLTGKIFDENLKQLGDVLGFNSFRPEADGDGTLDVCWEDEEKQIVVGFENKVDKTNRVLTKAEVDQCSGHANWLAKNFPKHKKYLFAVGEITGYHELASPGDLFSVNVSTIGAIAGRVSQVHAKKTLPEQIDPTLDALNLRLDMLLPTDRVSLLKKIHFG
jgi:Rad3-related DNA helicase